MGENVGERPWSGAGAWCVGGRSSKGAGNAAVGGVREARLRQGATAPRRDVSRGLSVRLRQRQTDKQELALFVCKKNAERNGVTTIQHRAADWTAWEDREAYDLIIGADVLYADTMHPHVRAIFERNLAPGGTSP